MVWLRSLLLALLAFVAAGPSCFTAFLWTGGSIHGARSREPGYRQRSECSVAAFADVAAAPRLWLSLSEEQMRRFGIGDPLAERAVEFGPGERPVDAAWMLGLLQAHRADAEAWPLQVMAVTRDGERQWYLVGGQLAVADGLGRRDEDLGRSLDEQGVRLRPRSPSIAPVAAEVGLGDVRLAHLDHVTGVSAAENLAGKLLMTPPVLVLDAVLLPLEVIVIAIWLVS